MSVELAGWTAVYSGKVRDLYIPSEFRRLSDAPTVLVVASDRVSAFDHVLQPDIPGKGELLTRLSRWWFGQLADIPNHLSAENLPIPAAVTERAMLVRRLDMYPIECVVRGYLAGSGWREYREQQSVCGVPLPAGLSLGSRLPEPIYTPAFKAPAGEHDENISFERTIELIGAERAAELRELSLDVFRRATTLADARGILLADTKFEFGSDPQTGETVLGDEVLTSDSSRYWDRVAWDAGEREQSFDKQIVRNWLSRNWNGSGAPPPLPAEVIARTAQRYLELVTRLTGTGTL